MKIVKHNGYFRIALMKTVGFVLILLVIGLQTVSAEPCVADPWNPDTTYSRGSTVENGSHEWQAKRTSTGVVPGTHKPTWRDLGACGDGPGEPPTEPPAGDPTPISIFGLWHAGNHYADWAYEREPGEFAEANDWIIHGNNGRPSVNLVILSFLHPMQVLGFQDAENPGDPVNGVPLGMEKWVVDYFQREGIHVMMSIGGITYTDAWDEALAANATQLGLNAAAIAEYFGVGIEIDYERNTSPNLAALGEFITAYRSQHSYNPNTPVGPYNPVDLTSYSIASRLTIDLAAGGRYLQDLNRYATENWLRNDFPVLDYANAMVHRSSGSPSNWQEHINGMPTYDPEIPPKAPNRFTGGLYLKGNKANCNDFAASEQADHIDYIESVSPASADIGLSNGMLGYMFWAAETPSARKNYVPTVPPNTCEDGMGVAAMVFKFPVPMQPLRQD